MVSKVVNPTTAALAGGVLTAASLAFPALVAHSNPPTNPTKAQEVSLQAYGKHNGVNQLYFSADKPVIRFTDPVPDNTAISELCTGAQKHDPVNIVFDKPIGNNVNFTGCGGENHNVEFVSAGDNFLITGVEHVNGRSVGNAAEINSSGDVRIIEVGNDSNLTGVNIEAKSVGPCTIVSAGHNDGIVDIGHLGGGSKVYGEHVKISQIYPQDDRLTEVHAATARVQSIEGSSVVLFNTSSVEMHTVGDQVIVILDRERGNYYDGEASVENKVGNNVAFIGRVPEYDDLSTVPNVPSYGLTFSPGAKIGVAPMLYGAFSSVVAKNFGDSAMIDIVGTLTVTNGGLPHSRFVRASGGVIMAPGGN